MPDSQNNREAVELKQKILDNLPKAVPRQPSPKATSAGNFRRMQIVEDDDDDADEVPATKSWPSQSSSKPPPQEAEMFPDISIGNTQSDIEQAKNRANSLFAEGSVSESVRWFSKAIWLVQTKRATGVAADMHSILHSNRAFGYIKLSRWAEAEEDCSVALDLNAKNTKAVYRRAMARLELGKLQAALEDTELVMRELPDPRASREAAELKQRILAAIEASQAPKAPPREAPVPSPKPSAPEEPFPEVKIERTRKGLEAAKDLGNGFFSKGSVDEAVRWFSKCLWLLGAGALPDADADPEWKSSMEGILRTNRAFAYIKLRQWQDADEDCSKALALNPESVKALYRRAMARQELGRAAAALEDVEAALRLQPDPQLTAMRDKLRQEVPAPVAARGGSQPAAAAAPTAAAPTAASPPSSGPPSPSSQAGASRIPRRGAAVPTLATPSVPAQSPKNSFELLRHFNSMKRHPSVLARYVRERVPPSLMGSLFLRAPIEADDLATVIFALRNSAEEEKASFGPDVVAEYLRQLLRTKNSDIQFGMLSDSEKEVVRGLLAGMSEADAGGLRKSLRSILG